VTPFLYRAPLMRVRRGHQVSENQDDWLLKMRDIKVYFIVLGIIFVVQTCSVKLEPQGTRAIQESAQTQEIVE